ncbi:MAG: GIY-YIG nuclease family protein [Candidatus Jorgensenbacteria bacterium]
MKGYVYVLKDSLGRFYVGSTDRPERRMRQHQGGHTQTTRNMKSWGLVLLQEYESLPEARRIERKIKRMKRKDYIEKMIREKCIRIK